MSRFVETPVSFPSRRKSLARLEAFAVGRHLAYETAGLDQEIAGKECAGSFRWDGSPVRYAQLGWLLGNEPEASRRRALWEISICRARELEPLRLARLEQAHAASVRMGYANYQDALQASGGPDLERLSASLEFVLAATEAEYADALAQSLSTTLGIAAGDAGEWDVGYWEKQNEPADFFRKELLAPVLDQTFSELGLRPETPDAIACDLESRPGKPAGAWCIPVRVPQEIHVVGTPAGGSGTIPYCCTNWGTRTTLPGPRRCWPQSTGCSGIRRCARHSAFCSNAWRATRAG